MGTYYSVKVVAKPGELPDLKVLQSQIDAELKQVNQEMSTYQADSELSLLNKRHSTEATSISANLALVLNASLELSQQSNGSFDVTVGPLVNLWGFGPQARPDQVPSQDQIDAAKSKIGYQHIQLQDTSLIKAHPDLYIDLSAIAKGHGVDRVADVIEAAGFSHYLVDIGGELRLKGQNDQQLAWTIAVEKPQLNSEQRIQKVLTPGDSGIATSGDYRNYFEQDGIRYSHTIDPATGSPISNHIVSVTVVSDSSMMADGLATAYSVMGVERALEHASTHEVATYIVEKRGDEFIEHLSSNFEPLVKTQ
ncbi:FAD:protein FMN transferase [Alginatibacterium sediminis]|nr:FAD:protein FMN transferase [Alginatibacterium sediminis]